MKIAILNITGGGVSGGYKKYLQGILPRLGALNKTGKILCASPANINVKSWLPDNANILFTKGDAFKPFRHSPSPVLKAELEAYGPDLLFVPIERYINYKNLPVVVMLQNMAPLTGEKTGAGIKEFFVSVVRRYETRYALKRAAAIIAPTDYVRNFLITREKIDANKIFTVAYGNTPVPTSSSRPAALPVDCDRFIFTAGSLEIYRGIEDLVLALPAVKEKVPGIKLVVAGGARAATAGYLAGLKRAAVSLGVEGDIVFLGNIGEAELSWCYSNCSAFALTSRVESFCFVALEALSHGCRIISTDSPCLPEVLGNAAEYYQAGDACSLSKLLISELSTTRKGLDAEALKRAASFTWAEAAAKTLSVFFGAVKS